MIGYIATGPSQSIYREVNLRIAAFNVEDSGVDMMKVVVQTFDAEGQLIADDPIYSDYMTALDLAVYLSESRRDGWTIKPCPSTMNALEANQIFDWKKYGDHAAIKRSLNADRNQDARSLRQQSCA